MTSRASSSASARLPRPLRLPWHAARLLRRGVRGSGAVARLYRAGLFDRDWYASQQDGVPRPPFLALAHFLVRSISRDVSPHPMIEPSWIAQGRARPGAGGLAPLLIFVRLLGTERERSPHPLFDPQVWYAATPAALGARGGALGHFLRTATPETVLPLPADLTAAGTPAPTLAEAVEAARAALTARLDAERWRTAPRWRADLDERAQEQALQRWRAAPLPPVEPGRPTVSVITPVRDRAELIARAMASVQAQTLTDWELIVVDDGSTDATAQVVAEAAAADPRIRLVRNDGQGVSRARNVGAAHARGRYVAWLDSDNTWTDGHLRLLVAAMSARGWTAAYDIVEARQDDGTVRYRALAAADREATLALLRVANHVDLNALVVTADLLADVGGFDESLRRTVDYDLVWRIAEHTQVEFLPVVGVRYREADDPSRITVRENPAWREVVKARRAVDWRALADGAADRPDGVSVLVAARTGWWPALHTALSAMAWAGEGVDVEVIVVDDAQDRSTAAVLAALTLHPCLRVSRPARAEGLALCLTRAFAESRYRHVLLVREGVQLWPGGAEALLAQLTPGVAATAPLVVGPDGVLLGAGTVAAEAGGEAGGEAAAEAGGEAGGAAPTPVALLSGLDVADAARAGEVLPVSAPPEQALLVRASDLAAVGGPDPLAPPELVIADLAARITRQAGHARADVITVTAAVAGVLQRPGAGPAAAPAALPEDARRRVSPVATCAVPEGVQVRPSSAWAAAGFRLQPRPSGRWEVHRDRPDATGPATPAPPRLRWAIKTASPVGPRGRSWGDTHFAEALAAALRRCGQQVVVDARPAARRPSEVHDDVVLVLRGLERVTPPAHTVNLLWVISHPDLVEPSELAAYDEVFAAGTTWARRASERGWGPSGRGVRPLLQATDPLRFRPDAAPRDAGEPVLFVGNPRNVRRPVVHDLLEAGVDVALYGKWDGRVDRRHVRAAYLPNEQVPAAYAAAGVVLNDHWPDMREAGFVSNRLFDAAACGARVVSDDVEGADELFGGLVRTFTTARELVELVGHAPQGWPDEPRRTELADRVRAEHSFDARAATLLEAAVAVRAERAAGAAATGRFGSDA